MRFGREGLVLGAGTVLAPTVDGEDGTILVDGQEDRLQALLSAAYGRAPPAGAVGHVRRAAKCWNDGDAGRAELHLALTGLSKLEPASNGAKRLFLADQLLRSGIAPNDICEALEMSERIPAMFAQTIFSAKDQGREHIRVIYAPWKPGQK